MPLENMVKSYIGNMIETIGTYTIKLKNENFNITTDAIELVNFMLKDDISVGDILEIGAGSGYISFKLYGYNKNIVAVEIQKDVFKLLEKNIRVNNLKIKAINEDIIKYEGKFDYIISNPPYYKLESGKYPKNEVVKNSKFETLLNLENICKKIYSFLKSDKSKFYLVYPIYRKEEVKKEILKNNLKIIREQQTAKLYFICGSKKN